MFFSKVVYKFPEFRKYLSNKFMLDIIQIGRFASDNNLLEKYRFNLY